MGGAGGKKAGKGKLPPTKTVRATDSFHSHLRDQRTIKRLKMYNSKIKRNEKGEIVKGSVLGAADRVKQSMARIAPDRRWFGNTRVIGQQALQKFRTEMTERFRDPYSVVIKQKKLPLSLLEDPTINSRSTGVQQQFQFANTFGEKSTRKRVKMASSVGSMDELAARAQSGSQMAISTTRGEIVAAAAAHSSSAGNSRPGGNAAHTGFSVRAQRQHALRRAQNPADFAAQAGTVTSDEGITMISSANRRGKGDDDDDEEDNFFESTDKGNWSLFKKGQSNRIWNELYKVIDSADVILYVVDARDPMGTRSPFIEDYLRREKKHKHFVLLLNKCDLIPLWATARWLQILSKDFPTIAFHASIEHPFGKGNLISILRQFCRLHNVSQRGKGKSPISVGVIGYPNVGKSSVINTLRRKTVCKSAPIPGETKIWQYVALTRSIFLIDCPGVVYEREGNSNINAVLKGVVRVERLGRADKTDVVQAVLDMVKRKDMETTYNITEWTDSQSFLEALATIRGKLLPGGVPDTDIAARSVLYDWQRGKIPWFVAPPFDSERAKATTANAPEATLLETIEKHNSLNVVGDQIEHGAQKKAEDNADDSDEDSDDDDDDGNFESEEASALAAAAAQKKLGALQQQQQKLTGRRGRASAEEEEDDDDDDGTANAANATGGKTKNSSKKRAGPAVPANSSAALGNKGFSTIVTATQAADAAAKKQKRTEVRHQAKQDERQSHSKARAQIMTQQKKTGGNSSNNAASAADKALWDAFVAAS